jgi:glycosyltransferase involved in cell wall biosynthesis
MSQTRYESSLTLIVPTHNRAKYLDDLVNSIYGGETSLGFMSGQTLAPKELIICDDCSTDNTEEKVKEIQKRHSRVLLVKTPVNSGTPIACNIAIENATSEFITRLDDDDMRESFALERMFEVQKEYPHYTVYDNTVIFHNGVRVDHSWKMGEYDFELLLHKNIMHSAIMYPKQSWKDCGGYVKEFNKGRDDWSFNVALGTVECCGINIESPGYLYRREQQNRSLTNSTSEHQKQFYFQMQEHFKEFYEGRRPMCCGNRRSSTKIGQQTITRNIVSLVGSSGMSLVQYMGGNYGNQTFYGPISGVGYIFSKGNSVKNVDNRDLSTNKGSGLLDLIEYGKPLFSLYKESK